MERVPGKSLRAVLRKRGWLKASLARAIGRQTAAALAVLHDSGYVHGDVKPDNLHLRPDLTAVLLDLGFAHRVEDDNSAVGDGYVLGTANYVAPELCAQPENDGPAADIFSLGVMLFELLTGHLPYPVGDVQQTMVLHRDRRPESLKRWRGNWTSAMSDLIDRMLSRDPQDRPTANNVVTELARP
jgi:serine/threonine protein kinase